MRSELITQTTAAPRGAQTWTHSRTVRHGGRLYRFDVSSDGSYASQGRASVRRVDGGEALLATLDGAEVNRRGLDLDNHHKRNGRPGDFDPVIAYLSRAMIAEAECG